LKIELKKILKIINDEIDDLKLLTPEQQKEKGFEVAK
jgi:hypothetical protein